MNSEQSGRLHQAAGPQEAGEIEAAASGASEKVEKPCCCCAAISRQTDIIQVPPRTSEPWVLGTLGTAAGIVPQVDTRLRLPDHFGTWRVRWGIGRMGYCVAPGLYGVGQPSRDSPVLVSANYKMSFDRLRCQLTGLDAWILVLDTKGVNVWCSAGKGTFGTDEIVRRVEATNLLEVVAHRTLVVPQLGAPGVAAHEVRKRSGFRVVYGPVRAADLPAFLAAGMQATPEMRKVQFPLRDRAAVIPVELVWSAKYTLLAAAAFVFLAGVGADGYSWARVGGAGLWSGVLFLLTCLGSLVLTPVLLPWLPGRAFSLKGLWLGLALLLGACGFWQVHPAAWDSPLAAAAWCLIIPAAASFLGMSFTGASTYTSLSGVRREMRRAVPLQLVGALAGAILWLTARFV